MTDLSADGPAYSLALSRERRCYICGQENANSVEHVYPRIRGGTNDPENLAKACSSCNSRKGARLNFVTPPMARRLAEQQARAWAWIEQRRAECTGNVGALVAVIGEDVHRRMDMDHDDEYDVVQSAAEEVADRLTNARHAAADVSDQFSEEPQNVCADDPATFTDTELLVLTDVLDALTSAGVLAANAVAEWREDFDRWGTEPERAVQPLPEVTEEMLDFFRQFAEAADSDSELPFVGVHVGRDRRR